MFLRKKKNPSGVVCVRIIDKSGGKNIALRAKNDLRNRKKGVIRLQLERILRLRGINMSVDKVLDIAKTITTMKIRPPVSNETMTKTMLMTAKHRSIAALFNENFWDDTF